MNCNFTKINNYYIYFSGKVFRNKRNLKRHQDTIHEGRRDYQCEHCGKEFAWKQAYQNHVQVVHEGKTPRVREKDKMCPQCGRGFACNDHLTRHIEHVHEGQDYGKGFCEKCSKTVR